MILDIQLDQFIKFNINSIGVYRVCYDEQCLLDLGKQIESGNSLTDSDKIGLLSDVYHTAISGHSSITFYLNFIFKFKNEKNPLVLEQVAISLNNISSLFYKSSVEVQNGLNKLIASIFQPWAEKLGFNSEPSENPLLSTLRVTAISNFSKSANKEYIDSLLTLYHQLIQNQNPSVAKDLKPLLLKIAIRFGDEKEYQEIRTKFEIEKTMDQKLKALVALGSTSNKNLIQTSLNYSICNAVRPQDTLTLISALAINSKAREDTWKFVKQNWNLFEARYKQNVSTLGNIIKSTAGLLTSKEELKDIEKFFEGRDISAYKMALNNTIEQVKINSTFVTKANKDLEIWLKENGFQ
ncbi:hypothetical protein K502DRAFT_176194 [Neoconidiobolus thromboides FSU 785]|nr:hypothetical protein K502DRAFT_176194 [Neoconidiobolus thromboides FSU 785]